MFENKTAWGKKKITINIKHKDKNTTDFSLETIWAQWKKKQRSSGNKAKIDKWDYNKFKNFWWSQI
jgi:hypothetical protein